MPEHRVPEGLQNLRRRFDPSRACQPARGPEDVRIDDFNAAREAGLTPTRAARYATHCHRYRTAGRTPLTPGQAAAAPRTKP